jgi:dTDP-4-dehydrorhamnose reductase
MKKIVVLGSKGMAGHVIAKYLSDTKKYRVINASRNKSSKRNEMYFDATDVKCVSKLKSLKPDIVINCIGILVAESNQNPIKATYINGYFPHLLEENFLKTKTKIIHLSTDCIFSGEKGSYRETDISDAKDYYGQSKALGEIINKKDLTIRTSIIGPELKGNGTGLFNWIFNQKGVVRGFSRAYWNGITTIELAKFIEKTISRKTSGLIHLSSKRKTSKHDLLKLILETFDNKQVKLKKYSKIKSDKTLKNTKKDFNYLAPTYKEMIEELCLWIRKNHKTYPNYK